MKHEYNVRQAVVALVYADSAVEAQEMLRHQLEHASEMHGAEYGGDATIGWDFYDDDDGPVFHSETCPCEENQ